jgi:protein TonB
VYTYTEEMPIYPGGPDQLLTDISRATKYPAAALRKQEQGKVYIHFIVRPDGMMADVVVQKGVTSTLDKAAVEAVEQLGHNKRWQPGFQNRRAVSVSFTVPIAFHYK